MAIQALHVEGYRSVRSVRLKLDRLNVLVGPNGCGKSNLYRAVYLLAAAAGGQLSRTLAEEGGMPSVLWAGARTKGPVRMTIAVQLDSMEYSLAAGLIPPVPHQGGSAFNLDPHVKEEHLHVFQGRKRIEMMKRENATAWARDDEGIRGVFPLMLGESESVLSEIRDPRRFGLLSDLRQELLSWRFYHHFRTDPDSPQRHPQIGVRTPVLAHDGRDLAAALQTIREIGDFGAMDGAIARAFPGAELKIEADKGRFSLALQTPEFHRPFEARELSDGTLHYLCLLAALLSPRPAPLLAFNEPEASIHPDLLEPLAELFVRASAHSQLWITTHSMALAEAIRRRTGIAPIALEKIEGETRVVGRGIFGAPENE